MTSNDRTGHNTAGRATIAGAGFAMLCVYAAVALAAGGCALTHRDA